MADKKTQVAKEAATDSKYVSRKKELYEKEVVPYLMKHFGYKNINQCPKLVKITINNGLGDIKDNAKSVQLAQQELALISGQKPVLTKAKKSVANFKVREGMNVGVKVTLRQDRMYDFFDKLVSIALPRVRDFKGIESKFDGRGNYTLGIQEQIIFPEINIDQIDRIQGMNITFVTSANTDEEGYALLKAFGLPFKNAKND